MKKTLDTILFMFFAGLAFSQNAATFYEKCSYGGYAVTLPPGTYDYYDMIDRGISNDDISSLKVNSGYKVTLYLDNLSGSTRVYTSNVSCLEGTENFNDVTSSIKIEAVPVANGVAAFYPNCNYIGAGVNLPAGSYTLAQLKARGINNDDIDALRVAGGYTVTLFADDNFSGDRRSFTADFACLIDASHFENRTTSLKIEATSSLPATAAVFYPNCNFIGYPVSLPAGSYTLAQLKAVGINNDDIDALRVPKGYRVVLYSDDNFGGSRRIIPFDYSCLYNANHFDNKTTSLKIETYNPVYGAATVFGDCNYGGYAISLPEGTFNRDDLIVWGVAENTISSVRVTDGFWIQLIDQPYFANSTYVKFNFNSPCLAVPEAAYNDVTSSLVISWEGHNLIRGGAVQPVPYMEKGGFETTVTGKTVVSPNPASSVATINYTSEAAASVTLEIAGAAGNVLERKTQGVVKGLNKMSLDVSKLANGTYFVIISNNGKKESVKLVVQH